MNPELTRAYIQTLTGNVNTVMDWRVINDRVKGAPAYNLRGTFEELNPTLQAYNQAGYGIFCSINAMDGVGNTLSNVSYIRTHVLDLDDPNTALMDYDSVISSSLKPHFAVQTSPNKFHLYWLMKPYQGNDFFSMIQRKLAQLYNGDKSIVDASRILRIPGFFHNKSDPFLVTCWGLSNTGHYTTDEISAAFQHVNIIEHSVTRYPLGAPELQAPSLDWLKYALTLIDPNTLSYSEWMSFSAAIKQAGWSHTDETTLFKIWSQWCEQYVGNNQSENITLWKSHRDTQVGWKTIENRIPHLKGIRYLGEKSPPKPEEEPPFPEILDAVDCERYFKDCYLIEREARIFTAKGRYMNATQFNAAKGGRQFIISSSGKVTDEPWKAALRSTLWTVPKVDHVRFLPLRKPFEIITDDLGRLGLNTYIPAKIRAKEGDVSMFLNHMSIILPDEGDRKIWMDYMAHSIKFPGFKIQYAVFMQSAEGIGKSAFSEIMNHCLGSMYIYRPKAPELVSSGSKFNAWMRGKLAIMVDEIKVDERRELIEILKPMITDSTIEVQGKGVDQEMEDNFANWFFFSNHKDAIPINKNGRRYAIFYSALQSEQDILTYMGGNYFERFWNWLREEGGLEALAYYFQNYPIECGQLPPRAPRTTSYNEAIKLSQSPVEVVIQDAVEDGLIGFRGGFVSVQAALNRTRTAGVRNITARTVQKVLESMSYHEIGKTHTSIIQEDPTARSIIYALDSTETVEKYMQKQGYLQ